MVMMLEVVMMHMMGMVVLAVPILLPLGRQLLSLIYLLHHIHLRLQRQNKRLAFKPSLQHPPHVCIQPLSFFSVQ